MSPLCSGSIPFRTRALNPGQCIERCGCTLKSRHNASAGGQLTPAVPGEAEATLTGGDSG
jgi:hypothetical protein